MNQKITLKRTLIFAAIAVMVLATTAFAAGKIYSTVSHTNKNDAFKQLPTVAQMESIIKAAPKRIETFDNGFTFAEGNIVHAEDVDESGAVLSRYQSLNFSYTNGSKSIALSMEKQNPSRTFPANIPQITYQGITLYAHNYVDKIVPLDYVKTEQDKLDEASGRLNIGTMGGDTIETDQVQILLWIDGEVIYTLMGWNEPVSSDELVARAKQIIDQA